MPCTNAKGKIAYNILAALIFFCTLLPMYFFRQHKIFRILCLLLALHIFNISIDAPDTNADSEPEDLTINDQESIIELVLEKFCGIDNAMEEFDEPGDEGQDFEAIKEIQLYANTFSSLRFDLYCTGSENITPYCEKRLVQYVEEISPPPPKAIFSL